MVRTRRRLAPVRRGCFWRWHIFQATQPVITALPDLTATETILGRRTAIEAAIARLSAGETVTGWITT